MFSRHTHNKIKGIIKKLCKDEVSVNLAFVSYKIGSPFSTKDKIPPFLKSMAICKFVYASCNACYVGETARYIPSRIKEHVKTHKMSHIYQHLSSNENCINSGTDECFSILDYASTKYQLKIKEAPLHKMVRSHKWLDRMLSKQKKTLKITLCVYVDIYFFSIILFHFSDHLQVILKLGFIIH